jgi:hypothetical protein
MKTSTSAWKTSWWTTRQREMQNLAFSATSIVLAECAIQLNGQTDRQTGLSKLLGLGSEPELLPYHSSLLIIYIKAAMLVFDL